MPSSLGIPYSGTYSFTALPPPPPCCSLYPVPAAILSVGPGPLYLFLLLLVLALLLLLLLPSSRRLLPVSVGTTTKLTFAETPPRGCRRARCLPQTPVEA